LISIRHTVLALMLVLGGAAGPALAQDPAAQSAPKDAEPAKEAEQSEKVAPAPTWDRVSSIKGAAERLAYLHRARGAKAAYELIDNCYRTHSLAENYGEGFETCITQDYLETKILSQVYARLPPDQLQKLGAPSPAMLAEAMGRRITAAFLQYKMPISYAEELKVLVDTHGLPVFLAIVFPEAIRPAPGAAPEKK
jgi:cell pole-organizing protein PopZ